MSIVRDIGESKVARAQFGLVVDTAPNAMMLVSEGGTIVLTNAHTEDLFGYRVGELLQQSVEVLVPETVRSRHPRLRDSFFAHPEERTIGRTRELTGRRKDGTQIPIEISLHAIDFKGHKWVLASIVDISERKKAEVALRESEDRLRLLLDSTAEGIFGIDLEAHCTFCNPAGLRVLGYESADQLLGKNMHQLMHHTRPDGTPYPAEDCPILKALRHGEGAHVQDEVLWKSDRTSFHAEYWSNPQLKDKQVVGAVVAFIDITRRRRTKRALEKSEEKFAKAFHESPTAITLTSANDHRYLDVNETFERVSGYTREEVIGHTPFDIGIWAEPSQRLELVQRLFAEGNVRNVEVRFRKKDASFGDGLGSMELIEIDGDQLILSAIMDITDRKRALRELQESEEKFRTVFRDAPVGMVMVSATRIFLAVNKAFCEFLGYTEEELLGTSFVAVTHPDDEEASQRALAQILQGASFLKLQKRYIHKNGQTRWGEVSSSLVCDAEGKPAYIVSQVLDATERIRALRELEKSEQKFRTIFRDAPQGMAMVAPDGRYLAVNKAFCEFLGYSEEELLATDLVAVTHPLDRQSTLQRVQSLDKGPPSERVEKRYLHKNGQTRWGDLSRSLIRDAEGKPAFMVSQIVDITERKRVEAALHENEQRLQSAIEDVQEELRFETILADVSARFVNLPGSEVDLEIDKALRLICNALDVDHASLYQLSAEDPETLVMSHLFRDPSLPVPPKSMNAKVFFPWCLRKVWANEIVCLRNTQEAPPEAAVDMANWRQFQIRSALIIPMAVGGHKVVGSCSIDSSIEERDWPKSQQLKLKLIVDVFANALERKYAEQKLLESEARVTLAAESAGAGLWTLDPAKGTLWATATARKLFALAPTEPIDYEKFLGMMHPEDRETVREAIENSASTGGALLIEYRTVRPDGTVRWMMSRGSLYSSSPDRSITVMGITVDITDRKRMEDELRQRESDLREAQRLAHIGSWTRDPLSGAMTWSPEMYCIHGRDLGLAPPSFDELPQLFTPESWERLSAVTEQLLQTGEATGLDVEVVRPDGSKRWVSTLGEIERDSKGRVVQLRGTAQDITERRLAEARLRAYEQAVEGTEELIAVVDREYRVVIANRAFLKQRKLTSEQAIGRPLSEALNNPLNDRIFERDIKGKVDECFAGETVRYELNYNCPDVGAMVLLASYYPIEGPTGVDRVACILQDITQRKRMEQQLFRRESDLREAQRVAQVGSWTEEPATGTVTWSEEMYRILGRDPNLPPPSFEKLEQLLTADSWERLKATREEGTRTGHVAPLDLEVIRQDGSKRWISVRGEVECDAGGEVVRFRGTAQDITERKRMEQELRQRESALQEAQRVAQVGSWIRDLQTGALTWSDEMYRIYGCDSSLPLPSFDGLATLLSVESWKRLKASRDETLRTGRVDDLDLEIIRPDGSKRWVSTRGEVERDDSGRIVRVRGTTQDITERRKAEEALRESEERFRRVVEHIADAVMVDDVEGRIVFANDQFLNLFGFRRSELPAITFDDYIAPEYRAELRDRHEKRMKGEPAPTHFEYEGCHRDGKRMWLEVHVVPIRNQDGRLVGTQSAVRDITARKESERALRESEERFRTIANAAPVMIWMSGPDKLCTYLNKPWLDFTGRPLETQLGNGWTESVHPDDLPGCMESYARSFDKREPYRLEYRLRRHDGEYRWIVSTAVPRFNADGSFAGNIGSCVDDTEHRTGVEALRTVSGRLIQGQERERKRIARDLHDDINQRLAMLALELQQLHVTPGLSAGQRTKRIGKLFKDTTQISSEIQALSHALHSSSLEYLGLAPAIQGFCDELARHQNVKVDFVHSGVPPSLSPDAALALFRVAQEALHNAVKYSGVKKFEVRLLGTADELQLTVRDSGVGFGPEAAMHGHGLGLISMRERIIPLKGTISIVSKPKHGTEITARVPIPAETSL